MQASTRRLPWQIMEDFRRLHENTKPRVSFKRKTTNMKILQETTPFFSSKKTMTLCSGPNSGPDKLLDIFFTLKMIQFPSFGRIQEGHGTTTCQLSVLPKLLAKLQAAPFRPACARTFSSTLANLHWFGVQ